MDRLEEAPEDTEELKAQLGLVQEEIAFFKQHETRQGQEFSDTRLSYRLFHEWDCRLKRLSEALPPGREPSRPVVFLVNAIVEVLSKGPASERDIKTAVLERCKEHSIRPSNRGLIAGTGMDVATVCRVLFALGLVETGGCERNEDEVDVVMLQVAAEFNMDPPPRMGVGVGVKKEGVGRMEQKTERSLPTAHCPIPTTQSPLPTSHCSLLTA
eukprot:CAMPEP_0173332674 /NCGR_PEP_ID=MMETSP1144-20121109/4475_1 /TAXON_ID=483371 /ORGANISM="non described non described, Strain CCMP2298" /LENGTH=212 /DNA_ID=CAMNT_0014277567 /DNA_START=106 /DNA_END=741 /DNA_ORIENTATION=+